jgi:hypothetical protein
VVGGGADGDIVKLKILVVCSVGDQVLQAHPVGAAGEVGGQLRHEGVAAGLVVGEAHEHRGPGCGVISEVDIGC